MQTTDKILTPMTVVFPTPPPSSPRPTTNPPPQATNDIDPEPRGLSHREGGAEVVSEESQEWQAEEEFETDENMPPDAVRAARLQARRKLKRKVRLLGTQSLCMQSNIQAVLYSRISQRL